jgi:O-antigen/teichoic acid export membrane protein
VLATLVPLWLLAWQFQLLRGDILLALGVGLVAAPLSALARYNAMVANSLRWFPLSYVPDFIARPGLFLIAVFCLILASLHHNVGLVLLCFVAFVWVVALGQSLLMQGKGLRLQHWSNYQPAYARVILPRSAAMLIVAAVSFATADIVMLLAGFLLPPEQAAVAGVTVRLAAIAGFVLQAGQLFVLPDFAAAVARRDTTQGNALLWRVNGLTLLVIIAALVAALLLGRMVLSFFGEIYTDGAVLLTLFLVGQSIRALGGMNQSLLAIEGHQVRTAGACILALAVLVVCAAIFCRHLGLVGLGYAVIAAECAWLLALATQAQQHCRRRADLLWLARNA